MRPRMDGWVNRPEEMRFQNRMERTCDERYTRTERNPGRQRAAEIDRDVYVPAAR